MSFGAMAPWQAVLLLLGAAAAATVLFRLKVRPPRVSVPSLLLWRRVFDQARALTWWERVRRAVSLAATVCIAIALALAVTRPGPGVIAGTRGRTLIVLDSSWSMQARTSGGETRWARAVRQARALAAAAAGDEVALATTGDGLVEAPTSDLALIETAIDRLTPSSGDGSAWPRVADADVVHFITDGAVARAIDSSVVIHSVFEPAPNVAITAFGARPAAAGAASGEAYLHVANFAESAQQVRVSLTRGTAVLADQTVELAAGEAVSQVVPLGPEGSARLLAKVSTPSDALPIDDEAVAWIRGSAPVTAVVVSEDPGALRALLERDATVRATFVRPADYRPGSEDIAIFDRWVPAELPGRPALFIAPPAAPWLGKVGSEEVAPSWSLVGAHPVLGGVDPLTVDVKRARSLAQDGLVAVAQSDRGTPLVAVADAPDRRFVVLSFALAESNLASAPAFPILMGNTIEWLAQPYYGVLRRPGPIELPASTQRLIAPDGSSVPLTRAGDRAVGRLGQPGLYLVEAGGSRGVVGVNVSDPDVSNLARTNLPEAVAARGVGAGGAGWPWWMWAVGVAFALAAAEWWTWQRRITV